MTVEILFPEQLRFGENENASLIARNLPDADIIETSLWDKPFFADNRPDLIYCGGMTESAQSRAIKALEPYKTRLRELIDDGVYMLFTSTAFNLLGEYIEQDGKKEPALGLYGFHVKRELMKRYTGYCLGKFDSMTVLGFTSRFDTAVFTGKVEPFITLERGLASDKKSGFEGIRDKNLFATYCLGPFLTVNPAFTRYLLSGASGKKVELEYGDIMDKCFEIRLKEFTDKARKLD